MNDAKLSESGTSHPILAREESLATRPLVPGRGRKLANTIAFLTEEAYYTNGTNLPAMNWTIRLLAAELEREMGQKAPFAPTFRCLV